MQASAHFRGQFFSSCSLRGLFPFSLLFLLFWPPVQKTLYLIFLGLEKGRHPFQMHARQKAIFELPRTNGFYFLPAFLLLTHEEDFRLFIECRQRRPGFYTPCFFEH
jgi:hypothetical protein